MSKKRRFLSLLCNILVPILTALAVSLFFTRDTQTLLGVSGSVCFRYFTIDSNIVAALSCLAMLPYELRALKTGELEVPKAVQKLRFVGAALVTLTFLIVVCYLMPIQGVRMMTASSNLFLHVICPPLVIVSYLLFEPGRPSKRDALYSTGAVLLYALVYLVEVVMLGEAKGGWEDFYNFNENNTWPYFFCGILAYTYFLSRLTVYFKNRLGRER